MHMSIKYAIPMKYAAFNCQLFPSKSGWEKNLKD